MALPWEYRRDAAAPNLSEYPSWLEAAIMPELRRFFYPYVCLMVPVQDLN